MKQEHKILCSVGLGESCEPLGNLQEMIEKSKLFTSLTPLPSSPSLWACTSAGNLFPWNGKTDSSRPRIAYLLQVACAQTIQEFIKSKFLVVFPVLVFGRIGKSWKYLIFLRFMLWRWLNFALASEERKFCLQAFQLSPPKGHFFWGSEIIGKIRN